MPALFDESAAGFLLGGVRIFTRLDELRYEIIALALGHNRQQNLGYRRFDLVNLARRPVALFQQLDIFR